MTPGYAFSDVTVQRNIPRQAGRAHPANRFCLRESRRAVNARALASTFSASSAVHRDAIPLSGCLGRPKDTRPESTRDPKPRPRRSGRDGQQSELRDRQGSRPAAGASRIRTGVTRRSSSGPRRRPAQSTLTASTMFSRAARTAGGTDPTRHSANAPTPIKTIVKFACHATSILNTFVNAMDVKY